MIIYIYYDDHNVFFKTLGIILPFLYVFLQLLDWTNIISLNDLFLATLLILFNIFNTFLFFIYFTFL